MDNIKFNFLSRGQLESDLLTSIQNITMLRRFFGNLIFAIIARMLCGNHLNLSSNFFKAEGSNSIKQSLAQFLLSYRTTPNSTTGETPFELLLNRRLKTSLDLIHSDALERFLTSGEIGIQNG